MLFNYVVIIFPLNWTKDIFLHLNRSEICFPRIFCSMCSENALCKGWFSVSYVEHFVSYRGGMAMTVRREWIKNFRPSLVMVTSQYEWKILEWDVKPQNYYNPPPKFKSLLPRTFCSKSDWKRRSCEVVFLCRHCI